MDKTDCSKEPINTYAGCHKEVFEEAQNAVTISGRPFRIKRVSIFAACHFGCYSVLLCVYEQ